MKRWKSKSVRIVCYINWEIFTHNFDTKTWFGVLQFLFWTICNFYIWCLNFYYSSSFLTRSPQTKFVPFKKNSVSAAHVVRTIFLKHDLFTQNKGNFFFFFLGNRKTKWNNKYPYIKYEKIYAKFQLSFSRSCLFVFFNINHTDYYFFRLLTFILWPPLIGNFDAEYTNSLFLFFCFYPYKFSVTC